MLDWLRALFRRPDADPPSDPPLSGLAGEAVLLLAAYEGMTTGRPIALEVASLTLRARMQTNSIAQTEAELDAAERSRWIGDAHDWANRALCAVLEGDPYRETPRPDQRLRAVGARVREAIAADSIAAVARALAEYVSFAREHTAHGTSEAGSATKRRS